MDQSPVQKPFDLAAFRQPVAQPQGATPEQLAEALGPFAPPEDYDFGDEFDPEVPRPLPRPNRRGSYASRRRSQPLILIVLGIAFVVFRMLPSIEDLGHYILPLWYLHWGGLLFFIGGIGALIRNLLTWDDFQYIRDGIPAIGRVIHLRQAVVPQFHNGVQVASHGSFRALVEYTNPQREQRAFAFFETTTFPESKAPRYESGLEIGDYVTLVSLPGDFATNLRLYAWTGLNPNDDWPKFDGKPLRGMTPLKALLLTKSVLLGLWLFVGFLHLFLYFPEEWNWKWGGIYSLAGVLIAFGVVTLFALRNPKTEPVSLANPPQLRHKILGGFVVGVVGLLGGLFMMSLLNSLCDRSLPVLRSVEIVNSWETTHNFLIRHYEVELRPLRGGADFKKGISVSNLFQLQAAGSRYGVELVRPGWLRLHWVEGIRPVEWQLASNPPTDVEKARIVRFKSIQTSEVYPLMPCIHVNKDLTVPPPPDLVALAAHDLAQQSQMQVEK
ncbi:MAG: hypothetical protein DWH91_03430 [Planctomycetota bacterium]|nr:MAG: hypothetical protein DWH91_03430 [Planctomycetota bacterium]